MSHHPIPSLLSERLAQKLDKRAARINEPEEKLCYPSQTIEAESGRTRTRLRVATCAVAVLGIPFAANYWPGSAAATRSFKPAATVASQSVAPPFVNVWRVDERSGTEYYSNGLRIEREFEVSTKPRRYWALQRDDGGWVELSCPSGIVYHTTESPMEPFDPDHSDALKRAGASLLAYTRKHELYNFVIDCFGRVFRIVAEGDPANHAGHSVWADANLIYLGLNDSFVGISFEGQTNSPSPPPTPAQTAAAKLLTDMLRCKYSIAAENCVTHAQVSVNPGNMQLGYHTDWAAGFPFHELGLGNGYEQPTPATTLFGFGYGPDLLEALRGKPWPGLVVAEQQLVGDAAAHGRTTSAHRKLLQRKYREAADAVRVRASGTEKRHDKS